MIAHEFYYLDFNHKSLWFFSDNNYLYVFCIIENFINVLNVFKHELLYAKQSLDFFIISLWLFHSNIIKKLIANVKSELFKHMMHDFDKLHYWIHHFLWKSCSSKQINWNHDCCHIMTFSNKRDLIIFREYINQWNHMHVCKFFEKLIDQRWQVCIFLCDMIQFHCHIYLSVLSQNLLLDKKPEVSVRFITLLQQAVCFLLL